MTPEEIRETALDTLQEWYPKYPDGISKNLPYARNADGLTYRLESGDFIGYFRIRVEIEMLGEEL